MLLAVSEAVAAADVALVVESGEDSPAAVVGPSEVTAGEAVTAMEASEVESLLVAVVSLDTSLTAADPDVEEPPTVDVSLVSAVTTGTWVVVSDALGASFSVTVSIEVSMVSVRLSFTVFVLDT